MLEKRRGILGEEHPDTIWFLSSPAFTFEDQGKLNEAAAIKSDVLETRRRILSEKHLFTVMAIADLTSTIGH